MEYSKYFRFLWILAVAFAGSTGQADNKIKQKSSSSSSDLLAYGYSSYNRADQGGFSYFDEDRQRRGRFSGRGSRRGPYDHLRSRRKSYYEGGLDFDSTLRRTRRKPLARDVFHIKSTISRKCLDVSRSSHFIGERLHLWSCHGHANQKFIYDRRTKQIRMTHARGLCFEVRGNRVVQARCSQWRNDAQQFVYDPKFDLIINPNNRLCLELAHLRHEGSELRANRCNLHKMTQKFQIQEGYGGSSFGRGYHQRQRNSWGEIKITIEIGQTKEVETNGVEGEIVKIVGIDRDVEEVTTKVVLK